MRTTIRVLGADVTLEGGEWSGSDPDVLRVVRGFAETTIKLSLRYHPDPDLALAQTVAEELHGEVVYWSPPPEGDPETVY